MQKPLDVGVRCLPACAASTKRVGGANLLRQRIARPRGTQRIELERNRDAHALDAHPLCKREEVAEVVDRQRHVDGIDRRSLKRGVVHHRRQRVQRVRADDAEDARRRWSRA